MTSAVQDHTELLHRRLEAQFEAYSECLARMIARGEAPGPSRRPLADIAHALQRMAEGRYGVCERCGRAIPAERLELVPHARYCPACRPGD